MPCTAESPSPRPIFLVVKKGSKILAWVASFISEPLSLNLPDDVLSWLQLAGCKIGLDVVVIHILLFRSQQDGADVLSNRLAGVDDQVHHDLLNLRGIDSNRRRVVSELQPQLDVLGDRRLNEGTDI